MKSRKQSTIKIEIPEEGIRLNKYIAACGICSRREADTMIAGGRVTVNGAIAEVGTRVMNTDQVDVDGVGIKEQESKAVLAFYKPIGVTCTAKDAHASKTIHDCIKYPIRLTYAGRLDRDSEGLILMTNDGDLIDRMMRGANGHEKEYIVKIDKPISPEFLDRMENGLYLKELKETTRPCQIQQIGKFTFKIVLTQGLNRQIRRMCEALGCRVKTLKRIRVMNIQLGSLKPGEYREITKEELHTLYKMAGLTYGYSI